VPAHENPAAVDILKVGLGEDLLGRTLGHDAAPRQEKEAIAVDGGQVEVVEDDEDGQPLSPVEVAEKVKNLYLVVYVQV
jgi:hypothetical protein